MLTLTHIFLIFVLVFYVKLFSNFWDLIFSWYKREFEALRQRHNWFNW